MRGAFVTHVHAGGGRGLECRKVPIFVLRDAFLLHPEGDGMRPDS